VTNEHLNTVLVISERTLAVIATVATGIGTSGVAVNPVTNTIYATSHADSTVLR